MKLFTFTCVAMAAVFFSGCSKSENAASKNEKPHLHVDQPPHGGTAIDLGDEYHVEFVRDAASGKMQAFVLDGEMEEFVRSSTKVFAIVAEFDGRKEKLDFTAIANRATGEAVGDTSLFEGQSDWLKAATNFDGVLDEISVRGTTYTNIPFNFPKGNDADETQKK